MYLIDNMDDLSLEQVTRKAKNAGEKVFSNDNLIILDANTAALIINDCEQLIYGLFKKQHNYTKDGVTYEITELRLDPKETINGNLTSVEGFFFQNYDGLKEGVQGANSTGSSSSLTISPIEGRNEVIIQGLQRTGTYFLQSINVYYNNLYFKDCVHTKISNDAVFAVGSNTSKNGYFRNCKISMHIRSGDYEPQLEMSRVYWNNCSRYFEFSDLTEGVAGGKKLCAGQYDKCSTIIRNLAINGYSASSSSGADFINNSTNSSWDVEIYDCSDTSSNYYYIKNSNNSFYRIVSTASTKLPIRGASGTGVNITTTNLSFYNDVVPDNFKKLSETDCKNPDILNKWGFFTKTIPSS